MKTTIRKAHSPEINTIADFQLRMALETEQVKLDPDTVRSGVQAVMDDPNKGFYLIAEEDEKVVASLMVTPEWSDWRAKTVWWIQSLYVMPDYRRKGIFKSMYTYLKNEINHLPDIAGIRLYVDKTNTKAQKVYEIIGMNPNHYTLYEDIP